MKAKFYEYYRALFPPKKHYEKKIEARLYFCEDCQEVIEVYAVNGKYREAHFTNMPTIHLERITCQKCRKIKGE